MPYISATAEIMNAPLDLRLAILCDRIDAMIVPAPEHNFLAHHTVFLRHPSRRDIRGPDHGNHALSAQAAEGIFYAGPRRLRRVASAPQVAPHVIANFH